MALASRTIDKERALLGIFVGRALPAGKCLDLKKDSSGPKSLLP
jgi:hypothetical protein